MRYKGLVIGLIAGIVYYALYFALGMYTNLDFESKYFLLFFFFFGLVLKTNPWIVLGVSALLLGFVGFLIDNYKGTGIPILLALVLIFISLFFLIFSDKNLSVIIWLIPAIILICFLLALVLKKEEKHE